MSQDSPTQQLDADTVTADVSDENIDVDMVDADVLGPNTPENSIVNAPLLDPEEFHAALARFLCDYPERRQTQRPFHENELRLWPPKVLATPENPNPNQNRFFRDALTGDFISYQAHENAWWRIDASGVCVEFWTAELRWCIENEWQALGILQKINEARGLDPDF
jgi:hypothetical protein